MASLTGQSVASSYEQLLHVDRDGGGNGTTLVDIKDGDNGTTFALQLATDQINVNGVINSTVDTTGVLGNLRNTNASGYGLKLQATGGTASQYIATFNDKDDNAKARIYGDGRITSFNSSGAVIRLESTNTNITTSELVGKLEAHISDTSGNLPGIAGSIDWTTNGSIDGASTKGTDFSLKTYIESSGLRNVLVGKANGVIELPIGQLKFPASQNASSDANTLDDYEEGEHTTTITGATSGSWVLDSAQNKLSYTKIGRMVTVVGKFETDSGSGAGSLKISLPFTSANLTAGSGIAAGSITINRYGSTSIATQITPIIFEGTNYLNVQIHSTDGTSNESYVQANDIDAVFEGQLSVTYFTD